MKNLIRKFENQRTIEGERIKNISMDINLKFSINKIVNIVEFIYYFKISTQ